MKCFVCGDKTGVSCRCGRPICGAHQFQYVDDANIAVTRNSPPTCVEHHRGRVPFPRPYGRVRAIERGEWFLESEARREGEAA